MDTAIRLGGVAVDPALVGLEVEFITTPAVTAAQKAGNFFQLPGTSVLELASVPPPVHGQPLTPAQALILGVAPQSLPVGANQAAVDTAWDLARGGDNLQRISDENRLIFEVDQAGAFGNNRRIEVLSSTVPGFGYPTATWNNNVLTLTVPNSEVDLAAIQEVLERAAAGRPNFEISVSTGLGVDGRMVPTNNTFIYTAGIRPNGNRIGMSGGSNSFFEDAFSRLGTLPLTGGAYQSAQTADTADIFIDRDGVIYGMHPVHGQLILGRVDIVEFVNPAGLAQVGTSYFVETLASGPAQVRLARSESDTQVISGALEMSNIDLSQEFSDMIITQRGFQANSRIITVSDSMLEELVNLKR
jgi:flagellar hook protein FlgE